MSEEKIDNIGFDSRENEDSDEDMFDLEDIVQIMSKNLDIHLKQLGKEIKHSLITREKQYEELVSVSKELTKETKRFFKRFYPIKKL